MRQEELSLQEARRLALHAQGFLPDGTGAAESGRGASARALKALCTRLGVVQIDSVNVLVRSHFLPAFSRLGAYARESLEALAYAPPRALFEYWGHEASLLPVELQPLFRWRMARAGQDAWRGIRRVATESPALVAAVLEEVRQKGPLAASDLEQERPKRTGPWWDWHEGKRVLEWLFWSGQVTCAARRGFERLYDLPERVLPEEVIAAPTPSEADAQRALVGISARALGVATEGDLRDYFRLPLAGARAAIAALVEEGVLRPLRVEGWRHAAFLHRDVRMPRAPPRGAALLSPFDNLIWERSRTHRLFGFHFRLEIYVPAPLRKHGYYVLPFLLGDALVARVDLKADRAERRLMVRAAHLESHSEASRVAPALRQELVRLASWLGLERVSLHGRGALTAALRRVSAARQR